MRRVLRNRKGKNAERNKDKDGVVITGHSANQDSGVTSLSTGNKTIKFRIQYSDED